MDNQLPAKRRGNPNMRPGAPSVNPRGRPRLGEALAEKIRSESQDGAELLQILFTIARAPYGRPADRVKAATELLSRAYGTPVNTTVLEATIENVSELPVDFEDMSPEQKRAYIARVAIVPPGVS